MRSDFLLSFALTFANFQLAVGRAANPQVRIEQRDASPNHGVVKLVRGLFDLIERQDQVCVEDEYFQAINESSFSQSFCRDLLNVPVAVVTVEITPTSTIQHTYTTNHKTTTVAVTVTPSVVTTVTAAAVGKREALANAHVRAVNKAAAAQVIRLAEAGTTASANPTVIAALSSACSCLPVTESTTTSTLTQAATIATQNVHVNAVQTVRTTVTGVTTTITKIISPPGFSVESTTTVSASATPISPAIVCPDDNGATDSQLINGQLFQYLVQCDTDITNGNLAQYHYSTFSECAAACGTANRGFNSAVCQGAVFYPEADAGSSNCFLKKSANSTVAATGINAVVLLRIAVAADGTSTAVTGAYATDSASSTVDTSSVLSSVFQNSTSAIAIITPAPMPARAATSYSTYVSDGETYSSAKVYSTYFSSDGQWYYSYYTTYDVAWTASSTQEYAYESSTSYSNSGSGNGASNGGANGGANGGTNGGAGGGSANGGAGGAQGNSTTGSAGGGSAGDLGGGSGSGGNGASGGGFGGNGGAGSNSTVVTTNTTTVTNGTMGGGAGSASGGSGSGYGGGAANLSTTVIISTQYSTLVSTASVLSTAVSGVIVPSANTSSPSSTFSAAFTGGNRSGTESTITPTPTPVTNSTGTPSPLTVTTVINTTTVSVTIPITILVLNITSGIYVSFPTVLPSGSPLPSSNTSSVPSVTGSTSTFTGGLYTEGNRSGTQSPSPTPSVPSNSTIPVGPTGTAPSVISGSPYPSFSFNGTSPVGPTGLIPSMFPSAPYQLPPFNASSPLGPTGTAPVTASGFPSPSFPFNGTLPVGPTGKAPSTFSNSIPNDFRSGTVSTSTTPIPMYNSSSGAYTRPFGTAPTVGPLSTGPSSGFPVVTSNSSVSVPLVTAPSYSFSLPSSNFSFPHPTGTGAPSSGFPMIPLNSTHLIGPTGTSPFTPSIPTGNRSGTASITPSGPSSFPTLSANSTCAESTTTVYATVTEAAVTFWSTTEILGCYSSCLPINYGGYGGFAPYQTAAASSSALTTST